MITVSISQAKAQLSHYINLATKKKEHIIICNHNIPVAQIKPLGTKKENKRKLGLCNDKIDLGDDFNETNDEIIESFYNDMLNSKK